MARHAALFDMDKTLVRANTGIRYARWRVRNKQMRARELARVLGWSLQYTFGVVDAEAVSRLAARTLAGVDEAGFADECRGWFREDVLPLVADAARLEVEKKRRGAAMRVAYITSAANAGVLPQTPLVCRKDALTLTLPRGMAELANERLMGRMKPLARLIAREPRIEIA